MTWAFVLEPIDEQTTRLLARASGDYERWTVGLMLQMIWRPMHFAMERKQLGNLRDRIERSLPWRAHWRRNASDALARDLVTLWHTRRHSRQWSHEEK